MADLTHSFTELPLMPSDERRTEMRAQINVLAAATTASGDVLLLPVADISTGGVRLQIDQVRLVLGDRLELEVEIDGDSIEATGEVVNVMPGHVGVRFVEISSDAVVTLELVLSRVGWD